jgi:hypothetical protein
MVTENSKSVIMANVPDFNPYGPAAGGPPGAGVTGDSSDLAKVLFAALPIAIRDDANVPAAIPPLLPSALLSGTPIDPATSFPPLPHTIANPFIGGIGQRGWALEVVSKIFINCILTLFFSPLSRLASRTRYCATVDCISIIIPRTARSGITASVAALQADLA